LILFDKIMESRTQIFQIGRQLRIRINYMKVVGFLNSWMIVVVQLNAKLAELYTMISRPKSFKL